MDNFLSFQKLPRGAGRHSLSSVLASGLAVVYLLTNAVGVYATEGTLWNDRRTAIQNRRSDGLVLAKASLPIPGMESPLFPPLSSLSHASVGEGMTQKSLAWLPRLVLPYGEIREVHLARPGAPLVLHIQDAHDVEEAQRNMGGLVTSLLKEGQVQLIGLEGASGPVPMDLFRQLPDHDVTRGVLDLALRLGYMGGAELAAFDAPQSTLWGVESPDLYAGNLTAFEKGESFKVQDQLWIDRLSLAGDAAVSQWYGKALSEFEIHRAGYEKGSEGLAEWLTYLWKNRPQNRPYAHLSRLKSVLEKESSLDFKAVEKERQSMAEVLARVLPAGDLQRLVDQSLSLRMGRVSFTDYHRFLESLCVRHGVRMGAYPHLKEYIAYVAAAEDIDRSGLIEELADLEVVVENRLAVTPEEQKVAGSRRSLGTLRKLVNHQLTPIEWHAYEKNRPDAALVAQTLAKWGGKSVPETDLQGLTAYENYALFALKRNRALAGNLLDKMRQEKAKVAVLVAGGFHTEGLTQILRESGASYVVVGPRISKVPENVHALEAIVRAPLPIETLLAGNVIHLATPRLSAVLPASLGQSSLTRDWVQRGRTTLGKFLFGYQGIHALQKRGAALDHSVFDSLRQGGYVSGEMTQSPLVLTGDIPGKLTALRVTEGEKRGHVLVAALKSDVNSDPNVFLNAGLSADPVHKDFSTDLVIHYYRESDIVQPGILVRWSRQGAGSIVHGGKRVAQWIRGAVSRIVEGFGVAWESFLGSRLGRILLPGLTPHYVVPAGAGREGGTPGVLSQAKLKRLADIFPNQPTHWSSVQIESLQFVLAPLGVEANSVRFISKESTETDLVFAMAVPGQEEAQPTELIVRFTLAVEAFPHGELFSVNSARGPPDMTVSLQAAIFRSDDSSLKRNLSAVVRQALSSLGESPFGRGNPVAYASAKRAVSESKTPTPTWLEKNVPRLKNVSLFSRSMESIFNRTLAERLQANFGFDLLRFLSQTNFTGGLGHVTYDYHESLGQDGADVASVFPLWDWIKGVVKHTEKRSLVDGYPPLPHRADGSPYESLGDMLRDSMEKREDLSLGSYRIPENAAFWDWVRREAANPSSPLQQESRKALLLRGKEIQFDVYALQAKYSGQPIFYLDAYVKEGEKKIRVFDQLYGDPPNAPWRAVQVLVYSQANQQLIAELVRQGYAQQDVVTLDHEVFAQFPDLYLTWQGIRGLIRHGIHAFNHTVFRPGLWNLPKPVAGLLGLDQRGDLDDWGAVSIARAANERAGAVTGVSRIHWLVLLKKLFRMESHKVVNRFDPAHPDQGMSSANGVLLEHWQGIEIRRLIDQTKESLRLSASMDDQMFYETLEQNKYRDELNNYKQRFEMIKAMYTLDLLLFLNDTQTQPQGGGHWLAESLSEVEGQTKGQYTLENIRGFRDRWQFLINRSFADETAWGGINQEFSELKEALLKRPVVSNVRRQVSYKGPDMYRDILQSNKEAFRQSGVRLIFGGRTFDGGGRGTFDHAKQLAQDVGAVAFLENYNSEDAPIIYRGATAGVMLANEFVEAAATSNSKIVVNGGWLISVFDGASPERTAVMDKATGNIKFAISYTHDVLRAGLAQGTLEILNGSLIFFDDNSLSETDGKGAGRRPSQASLLDCFASLGQAYESPHHRQEMLYRAIRWSYTADIHRQTQAFLDIENAVVQFQADVAAVAKRIAAASPAGGLSLEDQTETLLYKKASDGFVWKHRHNVSNPALLEGVGHGAGWVGFLAGFRTVKSRYYDQGRGSAQGDEEGLGLWSVQHHVKDENGDNELIQYVSGLLEGLPAFQPLLDQLREFQSDKTLGTDSSSLDVRVNQTLKALEFVQRTVDRVRESLIKSDLDSGADSVRGILLPLEKNTREALFQQNYTYQWRISVAPQTPDHDFNYMESGKELKDLRDALRLLLNEDSQGTEAIKQASYGSPDGAYFFPFVATRWKSTPALRNFALALGDEVERIKIEGGVNGWSDPSTQWRIRRVYAKFLGALDEMIEPTLPSETPAVVPKKQKSFEETVSEEAPKALRYDSLGSLNRLLLGGPAQPIVFGSLTADVERVREFVEQDRVQVKAAQNSLSQILGGWELRGPDGNLSESLVLQAGQSLGRAVRQRDEAAASAPVSAAQQVFMALVSFGDSLKGASIEDWNRWVALFARGFNGNLSDVQESVLGSIKSGRRLGIVLTETLMDGTLTEEDKTRLEELTILAAHPDQFEGGRLTWILPKGMKNLDSLWSIYPQLSPLKGLSSVALSKEDLVGSDGKYSIKKFLMKSQNQTRLENLNPADLYLDNRDEWVLENDIPNGLARLLISLAGGLVYDATERVGEELKQLYYLRTNA